LSIGEITGKESVNKKGRLLNKITSGSVGTLNVIGLIGLLIMMVLTTGDVIMRYIFKRPITGALELTELMMALTVSFGLAHAYINKQHISVDVFVERLNPRTRAVFDTITVVLSIAIYAVIAWRSVVYAEILRTGGNTTAALHIPTFPFVYIVAIGSAILCLIYLKTLVQRINIVVKNTHWWIAGGLILLIIAIIVLFATPVMSEGWSKISPLSAGLLGMLALVILLFSGGSIGVVMGVIGLLGMFYLIGAVPSLTSIGTTPYSTIASYSMSVVPLFILMGVFCFYAGLSQELYQTAYKWLGRLPGGLAIATIAACAGFAAVSGSSIASVATMGAVSLPEMKKYRYSPALATGCIAAGSSLGILIPPSVVMVVYGILTEQSIGKMFLAGFIPGILEAVFYMVTIYIMCRRNPLLGPMGERTSLMTKLTSLKGTWAVLVLFVVVIGGLYLGVFTATEAAGVGAFAALIFTIVKKKLTRKNFAKSLLETGNTTAMVFVILIGANILGYFLAVSRLPFELSTIVAGLPVNRYVVLIAIMVVYMLLGCVMSSLAMIVLTVPVFFPVITSLGFDPIWFGILIVRVVEVGQVTPPVGINVFVIKGMAKDVPMYTVFRGVIPFLLADFAHIALLIAFPQITLFLPELMK